MDVLIVDNVRAGQGPGGLYDYVRELGRVGCDVTIRPFDGSRPFEEILRDASSFGRVVAAGGDGTVSAISYLLRDSGIPLLAYPGGTANLLSFNLQLPIDPRQLARLTVEGPVARTDLGEFTDFAGGAAVPPVGFAVMAGAGFDARVMEGAAELKSVLGVGAYFLSAAQNLNPTVARFLLHVDGRTVETEGIAVLLVNFAKIQFDLSVTHDSDPTDGVLEVVVVTAKNVAQLIPAVWEAVLDRIGEHPQRGQLEVHRAKEIQVEASPDLPLQYDGEPFGAFTPFRARVLHGAASFVVPDTSPLLTP